jgi:hypothetical protein
MKKVKVLMLSAALLCGICSGPVRATLEEEFAGIAIVDLISKTIPQTIVDTPTELSALKTTLATFKSPTPNALPAAVTGAKAALTTALDVFRPSGLLDFTGLAPNIVNTYGLLGKIIPLPAAATASAHPLPPIVGLATTYAFLATLQADYPPDSVNTNLEIFPLATGVQNPAANRYYFDSFIPALQNASTLSALQDLMDWNGTTPGLKQYAGAFRSLLSYLQSDLTALAEFNTIFGIADMVAPNPPTNVYQAQLAAAVPTTVVASADYGELSEAASNLVTPIPATFPDSTDVLAWYNGVAGLHQAIENIRKAVNAASVINGSPEVIDPLLASNASVTDPQYGLSAAALKTGLLASWSSGLLVDEPQTSSQSFAKWSDYQLKTPIPAQTLPFAS